MTEKERKKILDALEPGKFCWLGESIIAYKTKSGGVRYGYQFRERGKLKRRLTCDTITEARDAVAIARGRIKSGKTGLPAPEEKRPALQEHAEIFQRLHSNAKVKRSWKRDERSLKTLLRFLGKKELYRITTDDVNRYRAWRKKDVSGPTVNRELALLKRMYNLAISSGLVEHNPVKGVEFFQENNGKCWHIVTPDEETALIGAARPHLKPLITVAIETGMRSGELFALDWRRINLKDRLIHVMTSTSGDTKSGKARWVPVTDAAYAALRALDPRPAGPVFTYRGKQLKCVKDAWKLACEDAGVRCRLHDLRHTAVSRMITAGVPVPRVQQIMGHATITTTMLYVHLDPRQTDDVRSAMAAYRRLHAKRYNGDTMGNKHNFRRKSLERASR